VQCSGKSPYRDAKRPRASWHVNIAEKFVLTIINSTTFAIAVPYPRATSEQEVSTGGAPRNRVRNKTRDRQSRVGVDHPHLTLQRRQGSRHQGVRNLCCGSGYRAMAPSTIWRSWVPKPIGRLLGSKKRLRGRLDSAGTHFWLACRHFVAFV